MKERFKTLPFSDYKMGRNKSDIWAHFTEKKIGNQQVRHVIYVQWT